MAYAEVMTLCTIHLLGMSMCLLQRQLLFQWQWPGQSLRMG